MEIVLSIEEAARLTGKGKEEFLGSETPMDVFNAAIAEKFNRIKTESAAIALRNGLEKREKELAKLVGVESFSNWEDLTTQVAAKTSNQSEGNTETTEKIKRLTEQVSEYKSQLKAARTETETVKKDFEHRSILTDVTNKAKQHIESLNLSLPTDPQQRARAIDRILKMELNGKQFQKNGDDFIVLDEKGQTLQDESLNDITATKLAESVFLEMYAPMQSQTQRTAPPTPDGKTATVFAKEDLTAAGYLKKAVELKQAGNKEALSQLTAEYRKANE